MPLGKHVWLIRAGFQTVLAIQMFIDDDDVDVLTSDDNKESTRRKLKSRIHEDVRDGGFSHGENIPRSMGLVNIFNCTNSTKG